VAIVKAISISDRKGIRKHNINSAHLVVGFGVEHDAHGGTWHRQVSLLAEESIASMRAKGLDVVAGNFAENITTEGLDLTSLEIGRHIAIGDAELIISQRGKICHRRCAIFHQAGDCVMPREGIFAVVLRGGRIQGGDSIRIGEKISPSAAIICSKESEENLGEELKKLVREKFHPAFVRFDSISAQEGGTPAAIVTDLTATQKITHIVIFDPDNSFASIIAGYPDLEKRADCCRLEASSLYFCRSARALLELAPCQ